MLHINHTWNKKRPPAGLGEVLRRQNQEDHCKPEAFLVCTARPSERPQTMVCGAGMAWSHLPCPSCDFNHQHRKCQTTKNPKNNHLRTLQTKIILVILLKIFVSHKCMSFYKTLFPFHIIPEESHHSQMCLVPEAFFYFRCGLKTLRLAL